jgi:hypothetical protein
MSLVIFFGLLPWILSSCCILSLIFGRLDMMGWTNDDNRSEETELNTLKEQMHASTKDNERNFGRSRLEHKRIIILFNGLQAERYIDLAPTHTHTIIQNTILALFISVRESTEINIPKSLYSFTILVLLFFFVVPLCVVGWYVVVIHLLLWLLFIENGIDTFFQIEV